MKYLKIYDAFFYVIEEFIFAINSTYFGAKIYAMSLGGCPIKNQKSIQLQGPRNERNFTRNAHFNHVYEEEKNTN